MEAAVQPARRPEAGFRRQKFWLVLFLCWQGSAWGIPRKFGRIVQRKKSKQLLHRVPHFPGFASLQFGEKCTARAMPKQIPPSRHFCLLDNRAGQGYPKAATRTHNESTPHTCAPPSEVDDTTRRCTFAHLTPRLSCDSGALEEVSSIKKSRAFSYSIYSR